MDSLELLDMESHLVEGCYMIPKIIIEIEGGCANVIYKDAGCELVIQDLDVREMGEKQVECWTEFDAIEQQAQKEGK